MENRVTKKWLTSELHIMIVLWQCLYVFRSSRPTFDEELDALYQWNTIQRIQPNIGYVVQNQLCV